ncbi:hypothetical protein [Uliginosibacterium sediminicola]|uniref:Uncharacterized protein n=1 Tax=Uliginosibacterium sediminicola TaxID=2024550 RepID=A0ABU9YT57_9RHOO
MNTTDEIPADPLIAEPPPGSEQLRQALEAALSTQIPADIRNCLITAVINSFNGVCHD